MREVDLSKYNIRTDLVTDLDVKDLEETYEENNITVSKVKIKKDISLKLKKKAGVYTTISFMDATDHNNYDSLLKIFQREFASFLKYLKINDDASCLVIGLGNAKATCDALGPLASSKVMATRHIYLLTGKLEKGFRVVSKLVPGVLGDNGFETDDVIAGIIKKIKPSFLIVIDSLATSSVERLCKTIQITDTGINPGSGIDNNQKDISFSRFNIPVIAIGIPMVIDAVTICYDTINFMFKHFSYNFDKKGSKLIPLNMQDYHNYDRDLNINEKKYLLGAFGVLSSVERKTLINDILSPIGYNLMVTLKDADFIIDKLSSVIASGINNVLHNIK